MCSIREFPASTPRSGMQHYPIQPPVHGDIPESGRNVGLRIERSVRMSGPAARRRTERVDEALADMKKLCHLVTKVRDNANKIDQVRGALVVGETEAQSARTTEGFRTRGREALDGRMYYGRHGAADGQNDVRFFPGQNRSWARGRKDVSPAWLHQDFCRNAGMGKWYGWQGSAAHGIEVTAILQMKPLDRYEHGHDRILYSGRGGEGHKRNSDAGKRIQREQNVVNGEWSSYKKARSTRTPLAGFSTERHPLLGPPFDVSEDRARARISSMDVKRRETYIGRK
ncbi:hypothetical protein DFH07DRAFT_777520 [Mycena maculata]|uniref:Uncharacterized protein n=1 Tax=Mycena maculata TaxID=230809 RepID=A0AAD7IIE9_9AGAR|nr:hypothetical protein DFH07DRAFT_777520 [Mycena maculata]